MVVFDAGGRVVARTSHGTHRHTEAAAPHRHLLDDSGHFPILDSVTLPLRVGESVLGSVKMDFSAKPLIEVQAALLKRRTFGVLFVFLLTTLILWLAARIIAKPLLRLADSSERLAQGDFEVDLGPRTGAEIGVLQARFQNMAQALNTKMSDLQQSEAAQRQFLARATEEAIRAEMAKNEAIKASQAKSEFLSKVSHEIRTPLNGLMGMVELLKETKLDPNQRELTDIAHQSSHSLLAIINEILDFSKIESGEFQVAQAPYDLRKLLTGVTQLFTPMASKKGLTMELELAVDLPPAVLGDALRLRQVVSNLVGNALKFTEGGGVRVKAWVETASADAAPSLFVAVVDSGVGISSEALPKIFEAFVQADNSLTRKHGGTGLGLSIARGLCEAMGGGLSAASSPGRGSTFTVRLPLVAAEAPPALDPATAPALQSLEGMRVLLVEDNDINVKLAQRMLARFGCVVEVAYDGREAVDKAKAGAFDVLLIDCQMPVMDGFEATALIRERERSKPDGPRVPIVAVTANASADDREACLAHGMDDVVAKPYSMPLIHAALSQYWGENRV